MLTEALLRSARLGDGDTFRIEAGTFITPLAREYAAEHSICLRIESEAAVAKKQPTTPSTKFISGYVDHVTGQHYDAKPEDMTHLSGNRLVDKRHPRIAFRGRIDSLQAQVLLTQVAASESGMGELCSQLGELLNMLRQLLACEVKDVPMPEISLFGMDEAAIHSASHDVKGTLGIEHPLPSLEMGKVAAQLNYLRTQVRETELAAANALEESSPARQGIIKALNRASSAVYILFCRVVAGYYRANTGK